MSMEVKRGQIYRDQGTKNLHLIIALAQHTENGEVLVVYRNVEDADVFHAQPVDLFNQGMILEQDNSLPVHV